MATQYGSIADLKERLQLEAGDDTRDSVLNSVLDAASRGIDRACGRRFWLDDELVERTFNPRGRVANQDDGSLFLVNDIGSAEGMVVQSGGATVTGYETSPDNALLDGQPITGLLLVNGSWGSAANRIRITAKFGWPAVPADIVEATLIQASRLFKRKDSPEGVTGSAEWGVVRLSRRDPDVWNLIEPYVLPGFA